MNVTSFLWVLYHGERGREKSPPRERARGGEGVGMPYTGAPEHIEKSVKTVLEELNGLSYDVNIGVRDRRGRFIEFLRLSHIFNGQYVCDLFHGDCS